MEENVSQPSQSTSQSVNQPVKTNQTNLNLIGVFESDLLGSIPDWLSVMLPVM